MNIKRNKKLNEFMNCYKDELGLVVLNLEKSKSEYEKCLRKFVINHINSSYEFRSKVNQTRKKTLHNNPHLRPYEITKTMVLETIITDEIFRLEEIQ